MDKIVVKRNALISNAKSTFGEIFVNGVKVGVSLEPTHKKINKGLYSARVYSSPRFGKDVILLENKDGRSNIEIHTGNYVTDSTGCILIGTSKNNDQIWHSNAALSRLINALKTKNNIEVIVK